jgi:4a-hydroxytetrahydrobiopterin dehydratase
MADACELSNRDCVPCRGGVPALTTEAISRLAQQLGGGWQVVNDHHLLKEFRFQNFRDALGFTNRIGEISEQQGHHPDLQLAWGRVVVTLYTHKVNGLTESDFILAAKFDQALG